MNEGPGNLLCGGERDSSRAPVPAFTSVEFEFFYTFANLTHFKQNTMQSPVYQSFPNCQMDGRGGKLLFTNKDCGD